MDQEGRLSVSHHSDTESDGMGDDDVFKVHMKHIKGKFSFVLEDFLAIFVHC